MWTLMRTNAGVGIENVLPFGAELCKKLIKLGAETRIKDKVNA